eukprot:scaffold1669_cov99-Skeletonema_dohrnii-CCMP3373.AAC.2
MRSMQESKNHRNVKSSAREQKLQNSEEKGGTAFVFTCSTCQLHMQRRNSRPRWNKAMTGTHSH